jgi:hypothetical protein
MLIATPALIAFTRPTLRQYPVEGAVLDRLRDFMTTAPWPARGRFFDNPDS